MDPNHGLRILQTLKIMECSGELWIGLDVRSRGKEIRLRHPMIYKTFNKKSDIQNFSIIKYRLVDHTRIISQTEAAHLPEKDLVLSRLLLSPISIPAPSVLTKLPKIPIVIRARDAKTTLILTRSIAIIRIWIVRLSPRPSLRRICKPRRSSVLRERIHIACEAAHLEVAVLVDASTHVAAADYAAVVDCEDAPNGGASERVARDVAVDVETSEGCGCEG
ncbi:hypothetical protein V8E51_018529 [Hyaloscypha variabilis]